MEEQLIIVSAGSFGREVLGIARAIANSPGDHPTWVIRGFLDDRPEALRGRGFEEPILGPVEDHAVADGERFLVAIGDPSERQRYATLLTSRGARFAQLISRRSVFSRTSRLGAGLVVGPFCNLSCNLRIGDHVAFTAYVTAGHDVEIGDFSHLGAYAFLGGGAVLGQRVTVHPHATILPGVRVGDDATVGAGSVVLRDVPAGATVFGNPARLVTV